jgi:hypothetical protein
MADRQYLELFSRRLADEGRLIEAGWVALRIQFIPQNAPPLQLDQMRLAYMSGAQHLFSSIMTILEEGVLETDADMKRMNLIHLELEAFAKELLLRTSKPSGSA